MRISNYVLLLGVAASATTTFAQRGAVAIPSRGAVGPIIPGAPVKIDALDSTRRTGTGMPGTSNNSTVAPIAPIADQPMRSEPSLEHVTSEVKIHSDAESKKLDDEIADTEAELFRSAKQDNDAETRVAEFVVQSTQWPLPRQKKNLLRMLIKSKDIADASNGTITADQAFIRVADEMGKRESLRKNCKLPWL